MSSDIGTSTLTSPLPGGSEGAVVTVRPLLTAEMAAPPGYLFRPTSLSGRLRVFRQALSGRDNIWLPVPVFLVEHPTAGRLLIDTGLSPATAIDPRAALGWIGARMFRIRMRPEQAVTAQLRELGIRPAEIETVIITHLHLDHAGSVGEFPQAVFVVTSAEWESAFARNRVTRGYVKRQYDHAFDYRLVDYNHQSINSFASFGRSFDLLADGSVTLVSTPGHTAGHQSVILRTRDGELLVCGDAAYTRRTIDTVTPPMITHDDHNFRRSVREIRAYLDMTPGATAVPGHDPDAWAKLDEVY
jgi:glyoxylase-like metal-dependent hydrolase (beta-lactamase superfamily II)